MLRLTIASLSSGAAYALLGLCLVLLYRLTGTLNFAQAAIGGLGAFTTVTLTSAGLTPPMPLVGGVAIGALVGLALGAIYAVWYRDKGTIIRSTVSIPMLIGLLMIAFRLFGDRPRTAPAMLPGGSIRVGGVNVTYDTIVAVVVVVVIALAVEMLVNRTILGARLRALAESPITAELLGIPVGRLVMGVWCLTGAVSAIAVILVAPTRPAGFSPLAFLVLPALAAALIGGFQKLGITIIAGFGIAWLEGAATLLETVARYRTSLPFFVIAIALLWQRRSEVWEDAR